MMVARQQERLLEKLNLDGLSNWTLRKSAATRELVLAFHDIFVLEENKLGCTSAIEHEIHINNSEPFKEQLRCIPPPLLDEVCTSLTDMLDAGAIYPSQSPWCNVVVLVQKKDGFVWISAGSTPKPRNIHTLCLGFRKCWRKWQALHISPQCTLRVAFGKSGWCQSPNSILLYGGKSRVLQVYPYALWALQCLLQSFNTSCKTS